MESVKKGTRVILIEANSPSSPKIPKWGSRYGCIGTAMTSAKKSAQAVMVEWDNGMTTTFYAHKLEICDEQANTRGPNLSFVLNKMKKRRLKGWG